MTERTAILTAISAALAGGVTGAPAAVTDKLKRWHDAAHKTFLSDVLSRPEFAQAQKAHWQGSYAIETSDGQVLPHGDLIEILRQINNEVPDLVKTGWSMFHVYTRPEIAPVFVTDPAFGEDDFVQCAMARDSRPVFLATDMWRVSPDGLATIIRPYWEDDPAYEKYGKAVGSFLSPQFLVRQLAELIRHARGLSERFDASAIVHFMCEFHGLSGREIYHHMGSWLPGYASSQDRRVITASAPIPDLATQWPSVVVKLAAPVLRLFMTHWTVSEQWVRNQQPSWIR